MAIAYVRNAGNNGSATPATLTWSAPTAGNLLVAIHSGTNAASQITPPVGWTLAGHYETDPSTTFGDVVVFTKTAAVGDTSPSFTLANSAVDWDLVIYEVSGANTTTPINSIVYTADNSGAIALTAEVIPQIVPSVIGTLVISAFATTYNPTTPSTGWTLDISEGSAIFLYCAHHTAITTDTSTAITGTWGTASGGYGTLITIALNPTGLSQASPRIVQWAADNADATNSVVIPLGVAPTQGNYLFAIMRNVGGGTIGLPSGWTYLGQSGLDSSSGATEAAAYHLVPAGAPSSYTFTFAGGGINNTQVFEIANSLGPGTLYTGNLSTTAPTDTTTVSGALVFNAFGQEQVGSGTPPGITGLPATLWTQQGYQIAGVFHQNMILSSIASGTSTTGATVTSSDSEFLSMLAISFAPISTPLVTRRPMDNIPVMRAAFY